LHVFADELCYGAGRIVLGLIPAAVYKEVRKTPFFQVALDILPEGLYQVIFIILNAMWTQIFLRIRSVSKTVTKRVFWWSYIVALTLLIVGGVILCVVVHAAGIQNDPNDPFMARYPTWEGMLQVALCS
jgi:hypothetical protein